MYELFSIYFIDILASKMLYKYVITVKHGQRKIEAYQHSNKIAESNAIRAS
ncbi:hypothetical protein [[Clostridium] colinum]|uniref:hypothetical protein n=1 Tax=[Clostridium] colinum TaxID=36835 RepID=UPI0020248EC0|nr:hypothetical protein [[Clostridium] colinum]